jgi:hypothetical protein
MEYFLIGSWILEKRFHFYHARINMARSKKNNSGYKAFKDYNEPREDFVHPPPAAAAATPPPPPPPPAAGDVILLDCPMEGYFYEPPIDTRLNASLTLVMTKTGVLFLVKVKRAIGIIRVDLRLINDEEEPSDVIAELYTATQIDTQTLKNGVLAKGLLSYGSSFKNDAMSHETLLELVTSKKVMASVSTVDYPDGEAAGIVKKIISE